jgi:hypothetical protein
MELWYPEGIVQCKRHVEFFSTCYAEFTSMMLLIARLADKNPRRHNGSETIRTVLVVSVLSVQSVVDSCPRLILKLQSYKWPAIR